MNELILFEQAKKGDKAAKEKIVSDNVGLVWGIARRFIGRGYDLDEIYQIGCIGLLKAIDRFETSFGVKFSTYAVPLITGEIKRFFRDNGVIKVSRSIKQNGYIISQVREKYFNERGEDMTISQISEKTGLSKEEIVEAIEANKEVESLYQIIEYGNGSEVCLIDRIVDEEKLEKEENDLFNKITLGRVIEKMDVFDRKLIELRYFGNKTQMEVAKELGTTQVQVSRLEKRLLRRLRKELDN